jgi:hypothetical protein
MQLSWTANSTPVMPIQSRCRFRQQATRDGNALNLFFELRAGGYGGSTYTLNYDAASDTLRGIYNQVVVKQRFEVVFIRAK